MKIRRPAVAMMAMAGAIALIAAPAAASQTPLSVAVTASATSVQMGRSVTLDATASNPGGNTPQSVAYSWSASGGTITGSGSQVTYTAPNATGTNTITVTAATGQGRSNDTATTTVTETVTPRIDSVEFTGSLGNPAIAITGSGFGSEPVASGPAYSWWDAGYDYGNQLALVDLSNNPSAWSAGQNGDYIGLVVSAYTNSTIAYSLGSTYWDSYYIYNMYRLNVGDSFSLIVKGSTCSGTVALNTPISCN